MSRPYIFQDANYNPFVITLILIGMLVVFAGALNEVYAGAIYATILLAVVSMITFLKETLKEDKKTLGKLFKSPFLQSTKVAVAMYLLAYLIIFVIDFIGKGISSSFSLFQFFSPLYLSSSGVWGGISSTYLASVIENSAGFKLAYGVFVAGTIEEYAFGFALYLAGWVIAIFVRDLLFSEKIPFGLSDRMFKKIITYSFVIVGFMLIHLLNATYEGAMFLYAGLFRLIMTLLLFEFGFGLAFTIGLHHANNLKAFLFYEGASGLGNIVGIIYIVFLLLLVVYTLRNLFTKQFARDFKKDITDYRS